MKKTLLLLTPILILTGTAAGQELVEEDHTITYGGDSIYINLTNYNEPDDHSLRICDEVLPEKGYHAGEDLSWTVSVPESVSCGLGKHPIYHENTKLWIGNLTVKHKGGGRAHVGKKKLLVGMDTYTSPNTTYDFYMTDDYILGSSLDEPEIIFRIYNNGLLTSFPKAAQANAKYGEPLTPGNELSNVVKDCTYGDTEACRIQNTSFTNSLIESHENSDFLSHSSIKPVHDEEGNFYPDGELIYAEFANYTVEGPLGPVEGGLSREGPYWFACREGAEVPVRYDSMGNPLNFTSYVVDASKNKYNEELMKCTWDESGGLKSNFRWEAVEKCEDGLDNDGDVRTDTSDPECTSSNDDSEKFIDDCRPGITTIPVKLPGPGDYEALGAQYENASAECNTDAAPFELDNEDLLFNLDKNPDTHICFPDTVFTSPPPECNKKSIDYSGFGYSQMPVAEYYPTMKYIEDLEKAKDSIDFSDDNYVYSTGFVKDGKGWDSKIQTLYEAEKKYGGYLGTCNGCQNYSTWKEKNVTEPEVTNAYDNDDSSTNKEAWNISSPMNAGVNNSQVISTTKTGEYLLFSDKSVFKGGFAPKCKKNEVWWYGGDEDEWICEKNIPWTQTVYLPQTENKNMAAIIFPPYQFRDDPSTYPEFVYNLSENILTGRKDQTGLGWKGYTPAFKQAEHTDSIASTSDIDQFEGRCWAGTLSDKPDDFSRYHEPGNVTNVTSLMSRSIPENPQYPVAVAEEMNYDNAYSCNWNFTTPIGKLERKGNIFSLHGNLPQGGPDTDKEWATWNFTRVSEYGVFSSPVDLPGLKGGEYSKTNLTDQIQDWQSKN